jgi:hypothetical protein
MESTSSGEWGRDVVHVMPDHDVLHGDRRQLEHLQREHLERKPQYEGWIQ